MSGIGGSPVSPYIKFLLILLLFSFAGSPAHIHGDDSPPEYGHVLYLVDTSYSMGVTMPGSRLSQAEIARGLIADSIERHAGPDAGGRESENGDVDHGNVLPPGIRYALATFSGPDSFSVRVPFTAVPAGITAALPGLEYWDITDIESALEEASRFIRLHASGSGKIVLVSDGVETAGALYSLPDVGGVVSETGSRNGVELEVLPVPLPYNRPAEERWKRRMRLLRMNDAGQTELTASAGEDASPQPPPVVYTGSSDVSIEADRFGGNVFFPIIEKIDLLLSPLMLLMLGIILLPVCTAGAYLTRLRKGAELSAEYRSRYFIRYRVKTSAAVREEVREMRSSKNGDLLFSLGKSRMRISLKEDQMEISSSQLVLIDGVAARHRKIHPGSRIVAGGSYYTIRQVEEVREAVNADTHSDAGKERLDAVSTVLHDAFSGPLTIPPCGAALLVFLSLIAVNVADIQGPAPVQIVERRIELRPYDWAADFTGGMEADAFFPEAPPLIIQGEKTAGGWKFEGVPAPGEVDLLCIHSHPDDESIDFGGLLARASMEGKTSAVLLLTDGESGLSRGPSREASSGEKAPLKETRIAEARAAMSWLGVDYYVRLGFRNHPYSSQLQVLPIEEVYADWGGYENVKSALKTLIRQLEPRMIAAPDGPSSAREHFEHDAAGYAVAEVVRELKEEGGYRPESFVTSIDPLQKVLFREAEGIEVLEPAVPGRPSPRMVQHRALLSHTSQIDARIIALEYTSLFQHEFYLNGAE